MKEVQRALDKAKIGLMSKPDSAFFTTICFSLKHKFSEGVPIAATNGKVIVFNPEYFMTLDSDQRIFLLLHEAMHVAFLHILRLGGRDADIWNQAADHVINLMLIARGFKMLPVGLANPKFKDMSTEEVYNHLIANPQDQSAASPEKGGGMGDIKEHPEGASIGQEEIEEILVRAAVQAQMQGEAVGSLPGEMQIYLDKLLKPKLPWHRILQKYISSFAKNDYTFRRPNRRFFPDHHLPSLHSETLMDIAIGMDASGSMSTSDFSTCVMEVSSIFKMMKPNKITLVVFDDGIQSVTELHSINDLMNMKFTGQGGTTIGPVLDWARKAKPELLLIFTDGGFYFTDSDGPEGLNPIVWLIHDNKGFEADYGKVIHYNMD